MARVYGQATATLTAQNTFTGHIHPADKPQRDGRLNISVTGRTDSTVTLQRTFDGTTFVDVESYTANTQKVFQCCGEGAEAYRLGIKTGAYGTDTVVCRLSH